MKKLLLPLLLLVLLSGCSNKNGPWKPEKGEVHASAILIIDDLAAKGRRSDFYPLLPDNLRPAHHVVEAENAMRDFTQDYAETIRKHQTLLPTGLQIIGTVATGTDKNRAQFEFIRQKPALITMVMEFDDVFYKDGTFPHLRAKAPVSVICNRPLSATRPVYDKHKRLTELTVTYKNCALTRDLVKDKSKDMLMALETRLGDIYDGIKAVRPEKADKLASIYAQSKRIQKGSICLSGSYTDCIAKLNRKKLKPKATDKQMVLQAIKVEKPSETGKEMAALLEKVDKTPAAKAEKK